MQPRKCPQCDKTIADDANYSFDDDLNLICGDCGKVAFPTNWQSNSEINAAIRNKKGGWGNWQKDNNSQSHFQRPHNSGKVIGNVHGLSFGGAQIPSDPPNRVTNCFPYDDVDDYQSLPSFS